MSSESQPRSRAAVGIDQRAIADAGLSIVQQVGFDGLTMKLIADRLDVRVPTLYHHVAGRSALINLVARSILVDSDGWLRGYDTVRSFDEWTAAVVDASNYARDWYHAYPGLARHVLRRQSVTGGSAATEDARRHEVDALSRLGVPEAEADWISQVQSGWALAAIAAEEFRTVIDAAVRDRLWSHGLRSITEALAREAEALAERAR